MSIWNSRSASSITAALQVEYSIRSRIVQQLPGIEYMKTVNAHTHRRIDIVPKKSNCYPVTGFNIRSRTVLNIAPTTVPATAVKSDSKMSLYGASHKSDRVHFTRER